MKLESDVRVGCLYHLVFLKNVFKGLSEHFLPVLPY